MLKTLSSSRAQRWSVCRCVGLTLALNATSQPLAIDMFDKSDCSTLRLSDEACGTVFTTAIKP